MPTTFEDIDSAQFLRDQQKRGFGRKIGGEWVVLGNIIMRHRKEILSNWVLGKLTEKVSQYCSDLTK